MLQLTDTLIVGIDLGTTHTVVASYKGGVPHILKDSLGRTLLPSSLKEEDGTVIVGQGGVGSIKRLMGRGGDDPITQKFPFPLTLSEGQVFVNFPSCLLSPMECSAHILKHIRQEFLGDAPSVKAVITVPAHFDEAARLATRDAARLAGFQVLRLINEPTAAALAYGLESEAEGLYAVYDLGGGTFDFSVLHLEKGLFRVVATGGSLALGGDDMDQRISDFLKVDLKEARYLKETAGQNDKLSLETLNELVDPLVQETLDICAYVLEDAAVSPEALQGVVLVGGATRTLHVQHQVAAFFKKNPLKSIDPDHAVALGACYQAQALVNGSDTLLLDVVPLSLGLETMGGIVEKLIPRNTPIPFSVTQEFTTFQDGQQGIMLHILQGERELAKDCRSLGHLDIRGLPALPAGRVRLSVTFSVDPDGLLKVVAQEALTHQNHDLMLHPSYGLRQDQIDALVEESQRFGREDMKERLWREAHQSAQVILKHARLLIDQGDRAFIEAIKALETAMETGSLDLLKDAHQALESLCLPLAERRMESFLKEKIQL